MHVLNFIVFVCTCAGDMSSYTPGSANLTAAGSGTIPTLLPSTEDYFSIDDILASQQRVPCMFELPVYRMGFLNASSSSEHLQVGDKLELPIWLAKVLCSRRRQIVSVDLPKAYRETQRTILSADANVVDLYKLGPYYYSMGLKVLYFDHAEREELSKSLLETFSNRFRRIMDSSQNAFMVDTTPLTSKLDETERKLFEAGQKAVGEYERWERGQSHKITTSSALQGSRKRKRQPSE